MEQPMSLVRRVLGWGCVAAVSAACSPGSGEASSDQAQSGGGGSPSGGAGTGLSQPGGGQSGDQGLGGGSLMLDSGSRNRNSPDATCAATHASVERVVTQTMVPVRVAKPVALYLMQDRSGSMKDVPNGANASKWTQTTTALNAFVNAPTSDGL